MSDLLNAKSASAEDPQGADDVISYFESNTLAMLIIDAVTGGIVDANAAATRLFELPNAFGSTTLADCLSVSAEQVERILEDAAKTGHFDFSDHHAPSKVGRREIQLQGGAVQYGAQPRWYMIAHERTGKSQEIKRLLWIR